MAVMDEKKALLVFCEGAHDVAFVRQDSQKNCAEIARKKKAIITTAGQRKKPGGSMSVILDQGKLVSELTFRKDKRVLDFVKFVSEFTGVPIIGEL